MLSRVIEDAMEDTLARVYRAALHAVMDAESDREVVEAVDRLQKETGVDADDLKDLVSTVVDVVREYIQIAISEIDPDTSTAADSVLHEIRWSVKAENVARAIFEALNPPDRSWDTALTEERRPFVLAARAAVEEVINELQ